MANTCKKFTRSAHMAQCIAALVVQQDLPQAYTCTRIQPKSSLTMVPNPGCSTLLRASGGMPVLHSIQHHMRVQPGRSSWRLGGAQKPMLNPLQVASFTCNQALTAAEPAPLCCSSTQRQDSTKGQERSPRPGQELATVHMLVARNTFICVSWLSPYTHHTQAGSMAYTSRHTPNMSVCHTPPGR
jgi:hypothetical protein